MNPYAIGGFTTGGRGFGPKMGRWRGAFCAAGGAAKGVPVRLVRRRNGCDGQCGKGAENGVHRGVISNQTPATGGGLCGADFLERRTWDGVVLARIFAGDWGEEFPMINSQNGFGLFVRCFFWK